MKITEKAYAMMFVGQVVGAELSPPRPDERAWVAVHTRVRARIQVGDDHVESETNYGGVGSPIFRVIRFDINASAVENPTYDYDQHMTHVQRATIAGADDFDDAIGRLEALLESWGVDPSKLGPLSDDYPVF